MQGPQRYLVWIWLTPVLVVALIVVGCLVVRDAGRPATLVDIDPAIATGMTKQQVETILIESGLDMRWVAAEQTYYAIERVRDEGPSAWTRRRLVISFNEQGTVASVRQESLGQGP